MGNKDNVNVIDIFTAEINYLEYTCDSYLLKNIYLDDFEESIIYVEKYGDIKLLSHKRTNYLINKEKEEFKKMKEKYDNKKEEYDKENPKTKEKYDALLNDVNLGSFFD